MKLTPPESIAVEALARHFSLDPDGWQVRHRGEGILVAGPRGETPVMLKVTLSGGDTSPILARLNWIRYLRQNGLRVPDLLESNQGRLVEQVSAADQIYAGYVYREIFLAEQNEIHWLEAPQVPYLLGELIGRMHFLAKQYRPAPGSPAVAAWHSADWIQAPEAVLHPSQERVVRAIHRLRGRFQALPIDAASFGLIHDDLHTGNIFCLDGQLVVIDFDNCNVSWFAADVASALLFRVWIGPEKERGDVRDAARAFLDDLLRGYRSQAAFPEAWLALLPDFLKLREISLFQSFYRQVDITREPQDAFFWYVYRSITEERPFLHLNEWF